MGLKGPSVFAGKTTAAFIKFNYTEETSNLDNKMREAALVWGFFSRAGRDSSITKNNEEEEDLRMIKESKK